MKEVLEMKMWKRVIPFALALTLLAGCGESAVIPESDVTLEMDDEAYVDIVEMEEVDLEDEMIALAGAPAVSTMLVPEASGKQTAKNEKATIDYSNIKDGYVMVNFTAATTKRLKVKVIGPAVTYTYDLTKGVWTTFPLSDGNGDYQVKVYEQTEGTKYAVVLSQKFNVTLTDEFAPFLRPNQYVDYANATNTIAMAKTLAGNISDPLTKVEVIYNYVVGNFTYDYNRAANPPTGYLPVLDSVLAEKKGICFDYAALMTGMLRSQGVPCKLVVGYAGTVYHAWVSVWTKETGWVDGVIRFDGSSWQRMDPTFASSNKSSEKIMKYIGDGSNYNSMYFY